MGTKWDSHDKAPPGAMAFHVLSRGVGRLEIMFGFGFRERRRPE